ncbi:MAG: hypothetical protein PHE52_02945 [Candidatus Pacebacteria bacterium]|nr:hypothetical protein [Candidatus Paceibacterota bacterium]
MNNVLFFLVLIFVIINIIQTWLIFTKKSLVKGGIIIGFLEAIEFILMVYLFLQKELLVFSILAITEIVQWLVVAYFTTKD